VAKIQKSSELVVHDVVIHDKAIANIKDGFLFDLKAKMCIKIFGLIGFIDL
jgi:hypothetical protein